MIDRKALIHAIELRKGIAERNRQAFVDLPYEMVGNVITLLKEQEAIIHCVDCYYYHKPEYGFTFGDCTYRNAWYPVKENGFCSLAKRKEGR